MYIDICIEAVNRIGNVARQVRQAGSCRDSGPTQLQQAFGLCNALTCALTAFEGKASSLDVYVRAVSDG